MIIKNTESNRKVIEETRYKELVVKYIREKYSSDDELAIQRKAINGNHEEYEEYNTYVEQCKARAKEKLQK